MARALPKASLAVKAGGSTLKTLIFGILQGAPLAAFEAHTLKFTMPERGRVLGMRLNVGLRGGTFNVGTVDVKAGATSLLTAVFDVAALTPATPVDKEEANLTATAADIAANTEMSVVVAVTTGTSPTWADVTLQIEYLPLGD